MDGIYLSENGLSHLTTLLNGIDTNVFNFRKKKRIIAADQGQDQGILESIESVIAAGVQGGLKNLIFYNSLKILRDSYQLYYVIF